MEEITKGRKTELTPELKGKDAEKVYDGQPLSGGATASVKGTTITYSTDDGKMKHSKHYKCKNIERKSKGRKQEL